MIRKLPIEELTEDLTRDGGDACRAAYLELHFGRPFDIQKFLDSWKSFYALDIGVMFVAEVNKKKIGAIGGLVYQDPFDGKICAQELIMYIVPEFRSFSLARLLIASFESWCKEKGCYSVRMSAPEKKHPLGLFLQRRGYRELETIYERVM